ncbi:hypothetical protein LTR86_000045 [Recurvomyces mirabilis]|nr:hypothetical protein LTR86_000045 [Recurvomyces mirabilis]
MDSSIQSVAVKGALPWDTREALRQELFADENAFMRALPKVELHVHLEGTLTPELRWKLAQRNGMKLGLQRTGVTYTSLEQLKASYAGAQIRPGHEFDNEEEKFTFFEALYGGSEVLKTKQDFYDLAMNYFNRVAAMNVRYCEVFFDPQGHTNRGVSWDAMMGGLRDAQAAAGRDLNLYCQWIMCFMRDQSPESAMEHYEASLPYHDMIIAIGLDSDEHLRPPSLFADLYKRARQDGLFLTCHCDVATHNTHEHIRQVVLDIGGNGVDRIDHGLNATEKPELMELIQNRGIGMTVCPWSYLRHQPVDEVIPRIRALHDAGIKIAIASDDPAYMEDVWVAHNLLLVKKMCEFDDRDMVTLARNAIDMSWGKEEIKTRLLNELQMVVNEHLDALQI